MKPGARSAPPPAEFEPFLFAEIVREENGMALTVASAFARLGLDPWQQAAALARLPVAAATASLAALLGRLPGEPGMEAVPAAARIIALLPRAGSGPAPDSGETAPHRAVSGSGAAWIFWAVLAAAAAYVFWF